MGTCACVHMFRILPLDTIMRQIKTLFKKQTINNAYLHSYNHLVEFKILHTVFSP